MAILIDKKQGIEIEDLDTIYITGAGYIRKAFKGIGRESAWGFDEVVWGGNLTRGRTFAFENIDDVDIGYVTNVNITFPIMRIEDFLAMQKILKERHVMVDYYNKDKGIRETKEMAITGNDRQKIYAFGNKVVGMQNFSIKFVATNRDLEYNTLTITYNGNGATQVGTGDLSQSLTFSEQVTLRSSDVFYAPSGLHFAEWNTRADGRGASYGANESITLWESLKLYAIWE